MNGANGQVVGRNRAPGSAGVTSDLYEPLRSYHGENGRPRGARVESLVASLGCN